jgi:uncharacterized protein (TIGR02099 family)
MNPNTLFSRIRRHFSPQLRAKTVSDIAISTLTLIATVFIYILHAIAHCIFNVIDVIATLLSWGIGTLVNTLLIGLKGLSLTVRFALQRLWLKLYIYGVRTLTTPLATLHGLTTRSIAQWLSLVLRQECSVLRRVVKIGVVCTLGLALLIAALITALRLWLLPDLTVLQPYIEHKLSIQLKQAVHIDGLKAQWHWDSATLDVAQVSIGAKEKPHLLAKGLHSRIPLYPLLWGTVATQGLSIQQLKLAIKQTGTHSAPHWFVAGIDLNQPSDGAAMRWLLQQADLKITTLTAEVHDAAKHWLPEDHTPVNMVNIALSNQGLNRLTPFNALAPKPLAFEHRFSAQFAPEFNELRLGNGVTVGVDFNHGLFTDSADPAQWQGRATVHIPALNLNSTAMWGLQYLSKNVARNPWLTWLKQQPQALNQARLSSDSTLEFSPNALKLTAHLQASKLVFSSPDGKVVVPNTPLSLAWFLDKRAAKRPHTISLSTPTVNLTPWAALVNTLPISESLLLALRNAQPRGDLSHVTLEMTLDSEGLQTLNWASDVKAASINTFNWQGSKSVLTLPALHNLSSHITLKHQAPSSQTDMMLKLDSQAFKAVLPHLLTEPEIAIDTLKGDVHIALTPKTLRVDLNDLRFSNTDVQGSITGQYLLNHTHLSPVHALTPQVKLSAFNPTTALVLLNPQTIAPALAPTTEKKDLGVLNVKGHLSRANIASLAKYLPVQMSEKGRAWLSHTLVKGQLSQVVWSLNGELAHFPFANSDRANTHRNEGFTLKAVIAEGALNLNPVPFTDPPAAFTLDSMDAFTPQTLASPANYQVSHLSQDDAKDSDTKKWPLIRDVSGNLSLKGVSLALDTLVGTITQNSQVHEDDTHDFAVRVPTLSIANVTQPVVVFQAQASAPANSVLHLVRHTPLSHLLGEQFNTLSTQGTVDVDAQLNIDVATPESTQATGNLKLSDVALTLSSDLPAIEHINARARFKQTGFTVEQASAQWLDGNVMLSGGLDTQDTQQSLHLQGRAHLEKIKQYSPNIMAKALLKHAEGAVDYGLDIHVSPQGVRWGVKGDLKEAQLAWPGFLDKAVGVSLPFSLTRTPTHRNEFKTSQRQTISRDVWQASLGSTVLGPFQGVIERQLQQDVWVMQRGAVALGDEAELNIPDTGLGVHITGKVVNLDHIQAELAALPWKALPASATEPPQEKTLHTQKAPAWLPSMIAIQVDDLTVGHRHYHDIIAGASRSGVRGENWQGNLIAKGINGYLSWTDPNLTKGLGGGQLQIKLTELTIPPSEIASSKQALLEIAPEQVPSVDLSIDALTLGTTHLGSVTLKAKNTIASNTANKATQLHERGWDIETISIQRPHIDAQGHGFWRHPTQKPQGQVSLDFTLKTDSLGDALNDFHYDKIIADASGEISGKISWQGTPFGVDIASLSGNIAGQFGKGRFLKADPGAGRVVGLFSLQNLPRRLTLDFKDTFGEGFLFDKVNVATSVQQGQLNMDSFVMKSSLATVTAVGKVSLTEETQALRFKVKPEINAGSASLLYMVINPVVGLSTLAAQWLFKEPLSDSLTVMYDITGPWAKPEVNPVKRGTALPQTGAALFSATAISEQQSPAEPDDVATTAPYEAKHDLGSATEPPFKAVPKAHAQPSLETPNGTATANELGTLK